MNYRLLFGIFIICTSFCLLSATTNTQETLRNNNTSQQNSVITIDLQPKTDSDDVFFQSLIKDIKSDRVEYKNGKIFIYITPEIAAVFVPLFIIIAGSLPTSTAMYGMHLHGLDFIFATVVIMFMIMDCFALYELYDKGIKPWVEKNPLITIEKDGIKYKDERLIPWKEITNISQYHGNSYPSLTLTCQREFGSEDLRISNDENLPIAFNKMSELIYQTFCYMKKNQDSPEK